MYVKAGQTVFNPQFDLHYIQFICAISEMGNPKLIQIADSYIQLAKSIGNTLKQMDDLNILLSKLPDIKLDENYVLDDFRPRMENNSTLQLYARKKPFRRPTDAELEYIRDKKMKEGSRMLITLKIAGVTLLKYWRKIEGYMYVPMFDCVTVPWTEDGVWQAYLLKQTSHLIGMRWHGGYDRRTFINKYEDIKHLYVTGDGAEEIQKRIEQIWTPDLQPSVALNKNCAYIVHCWFDAWKGLIQMKWKMMYDKRTKRTIGFHLENEKVLVEYKCGIHY